MATNIQQIQQLYIALYGRPADPGGQAYWGNILATDPNAIPTIAATFARSAEYGANFGGKSSAAIVDIVYDNLFGHPPGAAQRAQFAAQLDQGGNIGTVLSNILNAASASDRAVLDAKVSAAAAFTAALDTPAETAAYSRELGYVAAREYIAYVDDSASLGVTTTPFALDLVTKDMLAGSRWSRPELVAQQVEELYVAYFSRAADPGGFDYWTNLLDGSPDNARLGLLSSAFATSGEYRAAYSQATNELKVAAVYEHLFSRSAEQAGIDYWAGLMNSNKLTLDNVVTAIAKGALTTDLYAYRAKVDVAQAITAAIDTPLEVQAYNGANANAAVANYIARVKDEASFQAAIAPAAIDALIAGLTTQAASSPPEPAADAAQVVGVPMMEQAPLLF